MNNPFLQKYPSHIGFTNPELFHKIINDKTEYIKKLVATSSALRLGKKDSSNFIIFTRSIKPGYKYQITYFIKNIPFSDSQFNELDYVVERIVDEGYGIVLERIGGIN